MPGLVPGIHVLGPSTKDVDGRDVRAKQSFVASPGHDAWNFKQPRLPPLLRRHVWTAPWRQGFFGVSANGSGSGHVYGLEMRPVAAGPDGERGSNSNHCGALLRAMTARSVSIPVS